MTESVPTPKWKSTEKEGWASFINFCRTPLDAFAIMLLWRWFVAPLGMPAVGYAQAFGLLLCLGLLGVMRQKPQDGWLTRRAWREDPINETGMGPVGGSFAKVVAVGLLIGVAAITHLFMVRPL